MNKIIVILGLMFFVHNGVSQGIPLLEHKKDSIQKLIYSGLNDSEKIEKYKEAYRFFSRRNTDIAREFAKKGFELALQNNEYHNQVRFCGNLGLSHSITGNYAKGLDYYEKGLQIAKTHNLDEDYLLMQHRIATVWLKQGKKEKAAGLLDSIIHMATQQELIHVEDMATIDMGKLEREKGDYDKSLAWFKRNLEIANILDNPDQASYALLQIGIDYSITGEFQKAIGINHKGLSICLHNNNLIRANHFYNNLSICFKKTKIYDSAFFYLSKALENSKLEQNPIEMANIYMNIGLNHSNTQNLDLALNYYDSAYMLMKGKEGHKLLGNIYQNKSVLYNMKNDYGKSIPNSFLALKIAKQRKRTSALPSIYENIYQSYKGLQQYDSALFFFEKMTAANNSIYNIEKYNSTEHIKREIESAEKQIEIDRLQYESKRDRIILFSAFGAFLSFLLIAFLMVRNHKRKKELAEEHKKLEEQKVLTLIQEQEINAVNSMIKGQEKERKKISDELHDNLGSGLATLKLHIENMLHNKKLDEKGKDEILHKSCEIIDDTYQKVRNMAHVKSTGMVAQKGLILALEKLGQQISSKGNVDVSIDVFGFEKIANNPLKILLYNIIQELLTNAIKHAKASIINIQITRHENELNLMVEDNGSGFAYSEKTLEKGMGLYNIKNKIEHLKGTFDVDSKVGHGTTININIPI